MLYGSETGNAEEQAKNLMQDAWGGALWDLKGFVAVEKGGLRSLVSRLLDFPISTSLVFFS